MTTSVSEVIAAARYLTPAEQREVLARLWPVTTARSGREVWVSLRFSEAVRIVAYAPEQDAYVDALGNLLRCGALARLENESDGTYEIYGPDRTYYVAMNPEKEFAGLLSSWPPDRPPREVILDDDTEISQQEKGIENS